MNLLVRYFSNHFLWLDFKTHHVGAPRQNEKNSLHFILALCVYKLILTDAGV